MSRRLRSRRVSGLFVLLAVVALLPALTGSAGTERALAGQGAEPPACKERCVRTWKIQYRTHRGVKRLAYVLLPRWYGPGRHPPIPLVISPHGRGVKARVNARMWRGLPASGAFAVVNPQGEGRRVPLYSWGYRGQIADLARMPAAVERALPWLHVDRRRIYAVGTSMGGQETLLLVALYPRLLAGAAAFDSVTDMRQRYGAFTQLRCNRRCHRTWTSPLGRAMQLLARREIGGTPAAKPRAYRLRSPLGYAERIARSGVPLELWWSVADRVVVNQQSQSGSLLDRVRAADPRAPVAGFVGRWSHSIEMPRLLAPALVDLGLLPSAYFERLDGIQQLLPLDWPTGLCGGQAAC